MQIEVKNLSKEFHHNTVLEDITLDFISGNIYGIVGGNGSGKTMLLRAICGLIVPTNGEILINQKRLHKGISYLPNLGLLIEKPEFLSYLSGFDNLKLLAEINDVIDDEKIKEYMEMFELNADDKKPIRKYSLGMKQKIGIIQAIMEDPQCLVLDEAFNALDEKSVDLLRQILLKFRDEDKLIIITSHHREDIQTLCDYTYEICAGKINRGS